MPKHYKQLEGIRIGGKDISPSSPSHVPGVSQGNSIGNYEKTPGHYPGKLSTARRSTGINPKDRDPILPEMPNLSPP